MVLAAGKMADLYDVRDGFRSAVMICSGKTTMLRLMLWTEMW